MQQNELSDTFSQMETVKLFPLRNQKLVVTFEIWDSKRSFLPHIYFEINRFH